ncbi:FxSxx-COOH cyclophane-containing RiPP peptide [Streptomyces profundus]|uniref:FxSxx-COOH cyclophane-containing RiPP peptide n=1 Tax=Streptomyces profundus TaxID=2867410 RepID=UPI001D16C3F4|nr:FxSxx-COOH cyclophane-containing RiPP peptide [Streptomyces sp. MA3_2.13]UED84209.1 FXSXX-COOH protein [Streptomyces sp. MA3_2.13]
MFIRSQETVSAGALSELPDVLGLSLAELREIDHPVLNTVLAELRERVARPLETMWDFTETPPL